MPEDERVGGRAYVVAAVVGAVEGEHVVPLQVEEPAARRHGDCVPACLDVGGKSGAEEDRRLLNATLLLVLTICSD